MFISPNHIFSIGFENEETEKSGKAILIHPYYLWNLSLGQKIKEYEFFIYSVNEALSLSEKEEKAINGIVKNIEKEYRSNIDHFSKQIIVTHIENLLSYTERFYNRQFITREKINNQIILHNLDKLLTDYLNDENLILKGLPTVQQVASELNVSSGYLGSLLRTFTGQNTQQHIHNKLIEKAQEKLSTTELSISKIVYELGFEYLQSFNKLFKTKTNFSPSNFRQSFN